MTGFKSEAQREKFKELVKTGKMKQETFDKLHKETPKSIPSRVGEPKSIQDIRNKVSISKVGKTKKI